MRSTYFFRILFLVFLLIANKGWSQDTINTCDMSNKITTSWDNSLIVSKNRQNVSFSFWKGGYAIEDFLKGNPKAMQLFNEHIHNGEIARNYTIVNTSILGGVYAYFIIAISGKSSTDQNNSTIALLSALMINIGINLFVIPHYTNESNKALFRAINTYNGMPINDSNRN